MRETRFRPTNSPRNYSLISVFCIILLLLIGWCEYKGSRVQAATAEGIAALVPLEPTTDVGSLVFLHSNTSFTMDTIIDTDFSIHFKNAYKVKRRVEYCQWKKTTFKQDESHDYNQSDDDDNDDDDEEEDAITMPIRRTVYSHSYMYRKGWFPHRIDSHAFLDNKFHQFPNSAGAAGGPERINASTNTTNPLLTTHPSIISNRLWTAERFAVGDYEIDKSLVLERVKYNGRWYQFDASDTTVDYDNVRMEMEQRGFVYRAEDGYFYSQTNESVSVEDCSPGDMRIRYSVLDMSFAGEFGVSVVGELKENRRIGPYVTTGGYELGILFDLKEGPNVVTGVHLLERESWNAFWLVFVGEWLACCWALMITYQLSVVSTAVGGYRKLVDIAGRSAISVSCSGRITLRRRYGVLWVVESALAACLFVGFLKVILTQEMALGFFFIAFGLRIFFALADTHAKSD